MANERSCPVGQSEIWQGAAAGGVESASGADGAAAPAPERAPRFKPINRQQMTWGAIDKRGCSNIEPQT
jgi:hypothetical protein